METMEERALDQAKQRFLQSAEAASLLNVVRKHPLPSVGAAGIIGALLSLPRRKDFEKNLWALADIALLLVRKLVQTSLDNGAKLDEQENKT